MKSERGVIAILFVGLFALLIGAYVAYKKPAIFAPPKTAQTP